MGVGLQYVTENRADEQKPACIQESHQRHQYN